jgi:PAS domain S-box-containing protein
MNESALEAAERLAAIMESAVDGILVISEDGLVGWLNRAAVETFGYERDELIGKNVNTLMPSPYREEHDRYLADYLRTGAPKIIGIGREVSGRRKDGSEFPLYLAVSEGTHAGAKVFTGIVRDLSELRAAEERARVAEQLASLSVITAGIAHDIGTPMNVILGYADMLRDSAENPGNRRRAEVISEQVRRVTDLLQTLLNIARPQKSIRNAVGLDEVLEHALEFLREKFQKSNIEVVKDMHPASNILGDRDRLEQMFLNLMLNAADAMKEGGKLQISMDTAEEGAVQVSIEDTGRGIEPEALGRIFEPFYSSKDRGKGTGLGLVVSRSIVLDHDGSIDVESEVGKGTRFQLRFPAYSGSET